MNPKPTTSARTVPEIRRRLVNNGLGAASGWYTERKGARFLLRKLDGAEIYLEEFKRLAAILGARHPLIKVEHDFDGTHLVFEYEP